MSQQSISQWKERKLHNKSKKIISCMFCRTKIEKNTNYYYTRNTCIYLINEGTCIGGNNCCTLCQPSLVNITLMDLYGNLYDKIEIK
jgi:hypothetical protein